MFSIFSFYHLSIDPKITIFLLFRHFRPFPYRKFKGNFFQKTKKMTKKEGPGECPCASLISVCEGHLFGPSEIFSNCHRPRASKMPINSSRGQASYFGHRTPDADADMLSIGVRTDVIGASRKNLGEKPLDYPKPWLILLKTLAYFANLGLFCSNPWLILLQTLAYFAENLGVFYSNPWISGHTDRYGGVRT